MPAGASSRSGQCFGTKAAAQVASTPSRSGSARRGDGFVIGLPFGDRTQWVYNVMAAGSCTLRWRDEDLRLVDPVIVGFDEAGAEYPWLLRLMIRAVNVRQFLRLRRAAT